MSDPFHFSRRILARGASTGGGITPRPALVWLHHGAARLEVNGDVQTVGEGTLIFLRAGDTVRLRGRAEETHTATLILDPEILDGLRSVDAGLSDRFFWSHAPAPDTARQDIRQMADLSKSAIALEAAPVTALSALAFLAPLLSALLARTQPLPPQAPPWLAEALAAAREPRVFRDGAAGLVRAAGRAHPHVARTMQRHLGQTPSGYINGVRMDHAARRLAGSDDPVSEIAADVGLPNMSHFHKLFRAAHGMTPQAFRRDRQALGIII